MINRKVIILSALVLLILLGLFFGSNIYSTFKSSPEIINTNIHPLQKSSSQNNTKQDLIIDSIFAYIDPTVAKIKNNNPKEYTIIATGDIIPARKVNYKMVELNDFEYPFKETVDFLKSGDALFINLESPIFPDCKTTIEGMIFCGDAREINGLVFAGVTVANIANNHAGNYGLIGIKSTTDLLKSKNIKVSGNGSPAIITIRDKKFGFLGYNDIGGPEPGIDWADPDKIKTEVENLKRQVDFVIVQFHFGIEYTSTPSARQIELAHLAIDSGADLIIGNHPHWVQGIERYKGKFITYAHGNFIFDQMWSQETREGVLGKYTFAENGLLSVKFVPIIIDDYSKARFADKIEAEKILSTMRTSTLQIAGD